MVLDHVVYMLLLLIEGSLQEIFRLMRVQLVQL